MKVVLTKNVPQVGRQYDVVNVSGGYANNFLYPQGLAEPATEAKIASLEKKKEALQAEEKAKTKAMQEKLEKISGKTVTIKTKADEKGSLYKKVQVSDIVEQLKSEHEIELPQNAITLSEAISATGEKDIEIEAFETKATITLSIEKED